MRQWPARAGISCSVATTNIADRLANAVHCAMAQIADGIGLAGGA